MKTQIKKAHLPAGIVAPFLFLFVLSFNNVNAQTAEETDDKTLSPYFVVLSQHPETDNLPLKETSAKVNIVGVIADVTVKQVYVNTGKNTLEAIYTFPLSTKAAVYGMEMTIGKRIITAKIEEKQKARDDYEKAKSEGKRTSLLEQSRPNVFTMNVANILVNDTIVVELKYTELLVPEKGEYSFVYPTVVGPRYSNKPTETASLDDHFVSTPYTRAGILPTYKYGIEVNIHAAVPVQNVVCTSHKTLTTYPGLNTVTVSLDPSEASGGNRDVILNYSLQGNKIESGVMLYENGDENFFLLMVQPPKKVALEQIAPREYIFIVDVSGSMNGFPLEVSKKLLRNLIVNLRPTDKFNVVLFAGTSATLSANSLDANVANIDRAVKFIDDQNGSGGTELMRAMRTATALPKPDADMSRSFVLVSDGYVDIEKETFDFIRKNNGNNNFFSFGIGSSVNRFLMEGVAFMGNGEAMIVTKEEQAAQQAAQFRSYINTPVLTQIRTDFGAFQAYDVQPANSPDMMAERPIIIFGKYKGKPTGTITVKGKVGRTPYKQTFDLSQVQPQPSNSALRYLWARENIKTLEYYGDAADSILRLGLKYNLMTNYTSFIAVDEEIVADKDGKLIRVQQAIPLPEGVPNSAVGYDMDLSGAGNSYLWNFGGAAGAGNMGISSGTYSVVVGDGNGCLTTSGGTNAYSYGWTASGETEELPETDLEMVLYTAEEMPMFPGGEDSLKAFIIRNLVFPEEMKQKGITGTVYINFVVEKDGSLSDVNIIRGVNEVMDAEAARVVRLMPRWVPGKQGGKEQRVSMSLPLKFELPK